MNAELQAHALDDQVRSRARKNHQAILQRLMSQGARHVADKLNIDESTLSRMKGDGRLEQLAELLAVLGLKAVDVCKTCYTPEEIKHMHFYAVRGMTLPPREDEDPE